MAIELTQSQQLAWDVLRGEDNIFLTGAAGSGKSFLLREFLKISPIDMPILASTGAAAILVGGRTFHSFFGLGIFEGGVGATIERALGNRRVVKRLKETAGIVIDEVSMIPGPALAAAEKIARKARDSSAPWGGLRVIAVGDFAQLPPVNPFAEQKEWAFLDPVWRGSGFQPVVLREIMRTRDAEFLEVLNQVRIGAVDERVREFLNARIAGGQSITDPDATRLFSRRENVERYNLEKLEQLDSKARVFQTEYTGDEKEVERFKKHAPVPEALTLKEGALVMFRQNDVERRWVNGSLGHVEEVSDSELLVELLDGETVTVERADFTLLDAEGNPVASARNFPLNLAWAVTIHKAQGTTVDRIRVDLRNLWEPGQAYVALSRVRSPDGLVIDGWHPRSIFADPVVTFFHRSLE